MTRFEIEIFQKWSKTKLKFVYFRNKKTPTKNKNFITHNFQNLLAYNENNTTNIITRCNNIPKKFNYQNLYILKKLVILVLIFLTKQITFFKKKNFLSIFNPDFCSLSTSSWIFWTHWKLHFPTVQWQLGTSEEKTRFQTQHWPALPWWKVTYEAWLPQTTSAYRSMYVKLMKSVLKTLDQARFSANWERKFK